MYAARIINTVAIITLLCTLSACQRVQTQKKMDNLERTITSYEVALRWAMYRDAYSYHFDPDGNQPPVDLEALKEISVTGINVLEKLVSEDQQEALVKMIINHYKKNEGTVRQLQVEQNWWYSEENKQWFNKSDFPALD